MSFDKLNRENVFIGIGFYISDAGIYVMVFLHSSLKIDNKIIPIHRRTL